MLKLSWSWISLIQAGFVPAGEKRNCGVERQSQGGFAVFFFFFFFVRRQGVQAGSLAAVIYLGVSRVGLTMALWSLCPGRCPRSRSG